ncbi:monocarboxylate transporter 12-B-like isoform X2 [Haemaphysalis longicornis]
MGSLCRHYSCRKVLLPCSFIAGITVSLCYFATSIVFIDVFIGLFHGVAVCGLYVSVNILVAQHFEKRRTTACSLMFTAGGINTMVLPKLVDFFRVTYGIRGTFLLYGAFLMNAFPFALALRSPPWLCQRRCPEQKTDLDKTKPIATVANTSAELRAEKHGSRTAGETNSEPQIVATGVVCVEILRTIGISPMPDRESEDRAAKSERSKINTVICAIKGTLRPFLTLTFLVDALSFSVVVNALSVFIVVSTDLVSDRGIAPSQAVYLLYGLSASDTLFRPLAGLVIDSGSLSLESVMIIGFLLQCVAFELLSYFRQLTAMVIVSVLMGTTLGSRIGLQTPALVNDFGMQRLPAMIGAVFFCEGATALLLPPLIGCFRDELGSYSGLFHTMAALNLLLFVVWVLRKHRRRKL